MNNTTFDKAKTKLFNALDNNKATITIETLEFGEILEEVEKANDASINTYGEFFNFSAGIVVGSLMTLLGVSLLTLITNK